MYKGYTAGNDTTAMIQKTKQRLSGATLGNGQSRPVGETFMSFALAGTLMLGEDSKVTIQSLMEEQNV
jgi:hypothetical protein